ncbi:MAG: SPFH domain-containing protein, partial [Saccharofermentans sp.]|nr:SPFH domain-containing protein [Saccharofermentans sp.]
MGLISLIKNVAGTITGTIGDEIRDQYLEFFTCDSLGDNILVKKGANRIQKGRNVGSSEIISQGSVIAVPEGTALLLVDGGQIVDFTMVAGYYRWDSSTSPSVFAPGGFGENIKKTVVDAWTRMKQGGELSKQQRVYFVNLLEIRNQNFGTPSPVSYEDPAYMTVYIRLNGTFSYRIQDPITFFRNISGNIADVYTNDDFMGSPSKPLQPRLEFLDHITEALNKCSLGPNAIKFSQLPAHQGEFRNYMAEVLDQDWLQTRGVVVQAVAIGSVTPDDETRQRIQSIQTEQI